MSTSDSAQEVAVEGDLFEQYGLDLDTLYNLAQTFVHEKAEKAFHLTFEDRIILSALGFQIKYGKYEPNKTADPGFFDFVGKRRIAQWKLFGDMSTAQAKEDYIRRIDQLCSVFRSYVEAYSRNNVDKTVSLQVSFQDPPSTLPGIHSPSFNSSDEETMAFITQYESDIRAALNAQTREQFEHYAMQHHPTDADKRAELIAHLQDRHFHEYVAHARRNHAPVLRPNPPEPVHPEMSPSTRAPAVCALSEGGHVEIHSPLSPTQTLTSPVDHTEQVPNGCVMPPHHIVPTTHGSVSPDSTSNGTEYSMTASSASLVRPASMWTRSEVQEFKTSLLEFKDSIVRIGCGEVITIRVPAHPSGNSIVWEFATDDYDIGFGLYFEWDLPLQQQQEPYPSQAKEAIKAADTEDTSPPPESLPLTDEIVPVYRRNSHQEIYCGAHAYPGMGTYLLKFDNSYSLWRSKLLYYRVYYTC